MGRLRYLRCTTGNCGARSRVVTDTTIYDGETPAADKRRGWVHPKLGKAQGNSAARTKTCTKQARECDLQTRLPKNVTWIGVNPESEIGTQDWVTDSGIWKKWSGYHRRSLAETKMHCFKRLGERVVARTFERQVVELHVRVAILNRFTHMGRPQTVAVA